MLVKHDLPAHKCGILQIRNCFHWQRQDTCAQAFLCLLAASLQLSSLEVWAADDHVRTGTGAKSSCKGLELELSLEALYQYHAKVEVQPTEGPFGLIIAPSRELAHQTYEAGQSSAVTP